MDATSPKLLTRRRRRSSQPRVNPIPSHSSLYTVTHYVVIRFAKNRRRTHILRLFLHVFGSNHVLRWSAHRFGKHPLRSRSPTRHRSPKDLLLLCAEEQAPRDILLLTGNHIGVCEISVLRYDHRDRWIPKPLRGLLPRRSFLLETSTVRGDHFELTSSETGNGSDSGSSSIACLIQIVRGLTIEVRVVQETLFVCRGRKTRGMGTARA